MATAYHLDAATQRALDDLVATGRWSNHDEALREIVILLHDSIGNDAEYAEPLTPEEWAGVERGIAEADAGHLLTIEEVFDRLERRCLERE